MLLKLGRLPTDEDEYYRYAKAIYWHENHENERLTNAVENGVIEAMNKIFK